MRTTSGVHSLGTYAVWFFDLAMTDDESLALPADGTVNLHCSGRAGICSVCPSWRVPGIYGVLGGKGEGKEDVDDFTRHMHIILLFGQNDHINVERVGNCAADAVSNRDQSGMPHNCIIVILMPLGNAETQQPIILHHQRDGRRFLREDTNSPFAQAVAAAEQLCVRGGASELRRDTVENPRTLARSREST